MDDDQTTEVAQFNPHYKGDPSKVRGADRDGSLSIPARALHVTWGNDPRYWEWLKLSDTESEVAGFEEGAMLQQVNWLEVRGEVEVDRYLSVGRSYKVYYLMKFDEDAFGWSHAPIHFKVNESDAAATTVTEVKLQRYGEEAGKWHKVCVGEFKVVGGEGKGMLEIGMFETETLWWKGGMILAGIRLHPI